MNLVRLSTALTMGALLLASSASAQSSAQPGIKLEEPPDHRVGITMGYPTSVGVVFELSDRVWLRPEFSFSVGTSEGSASGISGTSSDVWTVGIGVSALFYLKNWDALRTYVAPRFAYTRGTTTVDSAFGGDSDLTSEGFTLNGLFGAQYAFHPRFSVFGEVGVGYTSTETRLSPPVDGKTETNSFGTRTGVGVIFFF